MNAAKEVGFTPGPWLMEGADFVYALDSASQVNRFHFSVSAGYEGNKRTPAAEIEANARLICAAPDLLAALQDLVSGMTYLYGVEKSAAATEKARTAIALATGSAK